MYSSLQEEINRVKWFRKKPVASRLINRLTELQTQIKKNESQKSIRNIDLIICWMKVEIKKIGSEGKTKNKTIRQKIKARA